MIQKLVLFKKFFFFVVEHSVNAQINNCQSTVWYSLL